jgi:hypothetical protein
MSGKLSSGKHRCTMSEKAVAVDKDLYRVLPGDFASVSVITSGGFCHATDIKRLNNRGPLLTPALFVRFLRFPPVVTLVTVVIHLLSTLCDFEPVIFVCLLFISRYHGVVGIPRNR